MAELINLRRVKKARAKAAEAAEAQTQRLRHGRTPAEKARDAQTEARAAAVLDQARLAEDSSTSC
jgi:hypothetical protein